MKNLKMFAIALLAMLVMVCGVSAATDDPCAKVGAKFDSKAEVCYNDIGSVLANLALPATEDTKVEIKLYDDFTTTSFGSTTTIPAEKEVVLDLNGHDVDLAAAIGVEGSLTVKNSGTAATIATANGTSATIATLFQVHGGATLDVSGKITLKSQKTIAAGDGDKKAIIVVAGGNDATTVNVSNDVTVESTGSGIALYGNGFVFTSSTPSNGPVSNVTLNVAGKWETDLYVIQVDGQITDSDDAVINVKEGTFTSNETYAFYASGHATWNVTGGKITGKDAFGVRNGNINIGGAAELIGTGETSVKPTGTSGATNYGAALRLIKDSRKPLVGVDLKITGGTLTAKTSDENAYAIVIDDATWFADDEKVDIAISNGSFASNGKRAAMAILTRGDATQFLENNEGMITGGEFKNAIIEGTITGPSSSTYPAASVISGLTKGVQFKTEGGKVVVGAGNVDDPSDPTVDPGTQTPGEGENPGNQGGTDNVQNPNTNDNILVYAGLGLVSLASVAFTTRKRED